MYDRPAMVSDAMEEVVLIQPTYTTRPITETLALSCSSLKKLQDKLKNIMYIQNLFFIVNIHIPKLLLNTFLSKSRSQKNESKN